MLIPHRVGKPLRALAREFPVLVVTGPRQSGKTTLCPATFPDRPYASPLASPSSARRSDAAAIRQRRGRRKPFTRA
jgi:hypothetical protein